jgi:hypothetical protein
VQRLDAVAYLSATMPASTRVRLEAFAPPHDPSRLRTGPVLRPLWPLTVTGFFHQTPLLRFVQKGRGVTSLTGEKLYEAQAIEAIQDGAARCRVTDA